MFAVIGGIFTISKTADLYEIYIIYISYINLVHHIHIGVFNSIKIKYIYEQILICLK
jgi:hypothetical protein